MRVFQINTFCGIKSTGRITTSIAQLLEKQGDECLIGFGAEDVPPMFQHYAYRIGMPIGRKVHGAIRKFLDMEGYGSSLATWRLIRKIEAFNPDVIHLHNLHGCYVNVKMLFRYLKERGTPMVWTLHDCWPFTGHCAYFDFVGCEKWQAICDHCPQLRSYPTCLWWDGSRRNFRRKQRAFTDIPSLVLVPPCHWLEDLVKRSVLRMYPIQVIENGVDVTVFQPAPDQVCEALRQRFGLEDKQVALAVAADWDERKGLRYLLEVAPVLDERIQLVVLGLTQTQIESLPTGILGQNATASTQELAAWYSLAQCLVNPTMEDNMPLVNLEALACGTPVVVFQTGGCAEVVDDTCGRVIPKGDALALAKAIMEIASQKESMKNACLVRASHFDSQVTYQKYLALYKELCQ